MGQEPRRGSRDQVELAVSVEISHCHRARVARGTAWRSGGDSDTLLRRRYLLGRQTFFRILWIMLREIVHLVRHTPATLRLRRRLTQVELYDTLMERCDEAGFAQERRRLVAGLSGAVVELGCGTGLMFPYYADSVRLLAIDLDEEFLARASARARNAAAQIEVRQGSAEAIPVPAHTQDAVVVSLMLCSVDNIDKVLAEVRRVLKPTGKLVLLEHVCSEGVVAGPLMNLLDPVWLYLNRQGCHMNRRPIEKLQQSGFIIHEAVPFQIFAAGLPAFPMRRIRASAGQPPV